MIINFAKFLAISANRCWQIGFLFITILGLASAPLLIRKYFKLILMFKDFIYLFSELAGVKRLSFFWFEIKIRNLDDSNSVFVIRTSCCITSFESVRLFIKL
jgi:hypothetical protein